MAYTEFPFSTTTPDPSDQANQAAQDMQAIRSAVDERMNDICEEVNVGQNDGWTNGDPVKIDASKVGAQTGIVVFMDANSLLMPEQDEDNIDRGRASDEYGVKTSSGNFLTMQVRLPSGARVQVLEVLCTILSGSGMNFKLFEKTWTTPPVTSQLRSKDTVGTVSQVVKLVDVPGVGPGDEITISDSALYLVQADHLSSDRQIIHGIRAVLDLDSLANYVT